MITPQSFTASINSAEALLAGKSADGSPLKAGSHRAVIEWRALKAQAGVIAARDAESREARTARVFLDAQHAAERLKSAEALVKAAQASVADADDLIAKATAELELVKAKTALEVATVAERAAVAHREASAPADKLETVALDALHVAGEARAKADAVHQAGLDKLAAAQDKAFDAVENAKLKFTEDMDEAERRLIAVR
jgi:hypothetical protein